MAPMGNTEPDEAWFDDPDAHYAEVRDYMRRLYRRCDSAEEFIGALSGLFPDLEDKVARLNAGAEIDFGSYDEADSIADPDDHFEDVLYYMERLHVRCDSSDEFITALSGLFPNLRDKVAEVKALVDEDLDDDVPDPDADIAAGRVVTFLSGAEMIATDLAEELEL